MTKNAYMVVLGNGKEVSWEEFSTWSVIKQGQNLKTDQEREQIRIKRRKTWLSKDRRLTEEHKNKLRAIKRSDEFKNNLRRPKSEVAKARLRGRKIPQEVLSKRKATCAVNAQWYTPVGIFPNKLALCIYMRDNLCIKHLEAIAYVDCLIKNHPDQYYRHKTTKNVKCLNNY